MQLRIFWETSFEKLVFSFATKSKVGKIMEWKIIGRCHATQANGEIVDKLRYREKK